MAGRDGTTPTLERRSSPSGARRRCVPQESASKKKKGDSAGEAMRALTQARELQYEARHGRDDLQRRLIGHLGES